MSKIVGQTGLFNLGIATSLGKLWIQTSYTSGEVWVSPRYSCPRHPLWVTNPWVDKVIRLLKGYLKRVKVKYFFLLFYNFWLIKIISTFLSQHQLLTYVSDIYHFYFIEKYICEGCCCLPVIAEKKYYKISCPDCVKFWLVKQENGTIEFSGSGLIMKEVCILSCVISKLNQDSLPSLAWLNLLRWRDLLLTLSAAFKLSLELLNAWKNTMGQSILAAITLEVKIETTAFVGWF